MELRIMVEPQEGATYDEQLRFALHAEQLGYPAFVRSDHYSRIGPGARGAGPTDTWVTLGALARETSTIRLASMLSSATFRLPALLAVEVAQVDAMSGGRVELGLGAGWFEREHLEHGIPFPPARERLDRLVEQIEIVLGIWETPEGATFTYEGEHYQLQECPALPRPVQQPRPPLILGGKGPKRTPRIAARYADEFNVAFDTLDNVAGQLGRVREACDEIGRPPGSLLLSVAVTTALGRSTEESHARVERIGDRVERLAAGPGLVGTLDDARERLDTFRTMGVERVYLQVRDLDDLDQLDLVAEGILREVG